MNTELINRLKVNEPPNRRIFGDMTAEEQEGLKTTGRDHCQYLNGVMIWEDLLDSGCCFTRSFCYRIKPAYQPEPEYVDLPIIEFWGSGIQWLGVERPTGYDFLPSPYTQLNCLTSLPGFAGFWVPPKNDKDTEHFVFSDGVANNKNKGETVIARFRK